MDEREQRDAREQDDAQSIHDEIHGIQYCRLMNAEQRKSCIASFTFGTSFGRTTLFDHLRLRHTCLVDCRVVRLTLDASIN